MTVIFPGYFIRKTRMKNKLTLLLLLCLGAMVSLTACRTNVQPAVWAEPKENAVKAGEMEQAEPEENTANAVKTEKTEQASSEDVDYAKKENWAYFGIGEDKEADLFMICPTVDTKGERGVLKVTDVDAADYPAIIPGLPEGPVPIFHQTTQGTCPHVSLYNIIIGTETAGEKI